MRARIIFSVITVMMLLNITPMTLAHHGRAAYGTEEISLQASITDFRFINPHVQVYFDITTSDGEVQHWKGELTAPNRLARGGWSKTTLKAGDRVTITGHQAINKSNAIRLLGVTLPDGTILDPWSHGILPP